MNSDLRYYGNPMNWESTKGDLISREALRKAFHERIWYFTKSSWEEANALIDNAPTVEYTFEEAFQKTVCENKLYCPARPQGECDNCKHFKESLCENSPYGWCSIRRVTQEGDLETQVPKDYYCSWFEKGGAE